MLVGRIGPFASRSARSSEDFSRFLLWFSELDCVRAWSWGLGDIDYFWIIEGLNCWGLNEFEIIIVFNVFFGCVFVNFLFDGEIFYFFKYNVVLFFVYYIVRLGWVFNVWKFYLFCWCRFYGLFLFRDVMVLDNIWFSSLICVV